MPFTRKLNVLPAVALAQAGCLNRVWQVFWLRLYWLPSRLPEADSGI